MDPAILIVALALAGQAPEAPRPAADERLDFMKASAASFELSRGEARDAALRLQPDPAFRLGNQFTGLTEGAIFFWLDDDDRPAAAVQVFRIQDVGDARDVWIHSFSSLSPGTLTARRGGQTAWNPATPGVAFRPVPDAPRPAGSAAQRSRQMRALAREFRAADDFRKGGWRDLRLLPTPIARYGKPGSDVLDGALFAFAEGTDPEVFLFLEARPGDDGTEWRYALAPMTVFAVRASHRERSVWELPDRKPAHDPAAPFFDLIDKDVQP